MKNKSLLLKIFLIFAFVIILSNAKVYAATLAEIEAKYPTGSVYQGSGECAGFANTVFQEFYGYRPSNNYGRLETKDLNQIQAGDVVRYTGNMGHSVWIVSRNGNTVRLAEANYDLKNGIRWRTADISEFSNLNYIYKAPYVLGQNPPTLSAPNNIQATIENKKSVRISWDKVDKATEYDVRVYRASDVRKGDFSKLVVTASRTVNYNTNYNPTYVDVDINESGDFCAFVHTKVGYNTSPNGGSPANFSITTISSITLKAQRTELVVGEGMSTTTEYLPTNANNNKITYSSSNNDIATVNAGGYISAKKAGTVTIYAKSTNNITASLKITVIDGIKVDSITLNTYNERIRVGQSFKLYVEKFVPENATYKTATFVSDDNSIATVDTNGNVTGVGVGKAYIRVYSGSIIHTCIVNVDQAIEVTGITLSKSNIKMKIGNTEELTAKITPSYATNKNITWSSSNSSVATVNNGIIIAKGIGTATITARCGNYSATCNVNVHEAYFVEKYINLPLSIMFDFDLEEYETELDNGKRAKVKVTSNNDSVHVGGSSISGAKAGFATITGYNERYGEFKAVCFVNDSIQLSDGKYKFAGDLNGNNQFDSYDVTLLRKIIEAGNLSEDNKKLCDINGDGKYDSSDVELLDKIVKEKLFTIKEIEITDINVYTLEMPMGDETIYYLSATPKPDNTTQDKTLLYSSSNTSIATVDQKGKITVLKPGKVTITVTASNGEYASESYNFTNKDVTPIKITGLKLDTDQYNLPLESVRTLKAEIIPSNATIDKTITWTSSNDSIVTVTSNGEIKIKAEGTATITAKTSNGITAICTVTGYKQSQPTVTSYGIRFSKNILFLEEGNTERITAEIIKNNIVVEGKLIWSSSDENIATVKDGVITAKSPGIATIYARTEGFEIPLKRSCKVQVASKSTNNNNSDNKGTASNPPENTGTKPSGNNGNSSNSNNQQAGNTTRPTDNTSQTNNSSQITAGAPQSSNTKKPSNSTISANTKPIQTTGTSQVPSNSNQLANPTSKALQFKDVRKGDWFYNAVYYTYTNKIISGYNTTTFAPNDKLTRGMLVTILHRMEGSPKVSGKTKFPDVQNSKDYYYSAVKWATDNKIVSGYGNKKFGPNDNITREDLAVILYKYARYKGKNTSQTNELSDFTDRNQVSSYATLQVKWAVGAGVVSGNADKTLKPKGYTTRAEASAMLENYCKRVGR